MDQWLINPEIFIHPFNCIISGPTMCGKTFFLKEIFKYRHILIDTIPNKIYFCYKSWQKSYDEFKEILPNIVFIKGLLDMEDVNATNVNMIIFDDLMKECIESESVMNIFTVGSHHKNTSTFFLSQNLFSQGKFSRDISLNANYLIIFRNPRDLQQIQVLARQMFPNNSKFLIESFYDSTIKAHGYLLIDLKQTTESRNRIQTGILPDQKRIIYVPKS